MDLCGAQASQTWKADRPLSGGRCKSEFPSRPSEVRSGIGRSYCLAGDYEALHALPSSQ